MALHRIQVTDFRCLRSVQLDLDPAFTLITGANASGKTSLLESMYVLGRGRSFRTRRLEQLIHRQSEQFVIYGVTDARSRRVGVGVEGSKDGMRARAGGDRLTSLAELASLLPIQIIDPEVHHLIEEGPSRRRRFLDWGVFHVEQGFIGAWQRLQQILKQRNAALRSRQAHALVSAWDVDFIQLGEAIHRSRSAYVDRLAFAVAPIARNLLNGEVTLSYRSGWAKELTLAEALAKAWSHDQQLGSTSVGPQRAEIVLKLNGESVKDHVSRGQQKLLAASLLLAQLTLFPRESGTLPTLLLDDPAAELDPERLRALLREISSQPLQLVVTSLADEFQGFGSPGRHYRIRDGVVGEA